MNTVLGVQGFLPVGVISSCEKKFFNTQDLAHDFTPQSDTMAFDVGEFAMAAGRALH